MEPDEAMAMEHGGAALESGKEADERPLALVTWCVDTCPICGSPRQCRGVPILRRRAAFPGGWHLAPSPATPSRNLAPRSTAPSSRNWALGPGLPKDKGEITCPIIPRGTLPEISRNGCSPE